jgi:hypothetical protein
VNVTATDVCVKQGYDTDTTTPDADPAAQEQGDARSGARAGEDGQRNQRPAGEGLPKQRSLDSAQPERVVLQPAAVEPTNPTWLVEGSATG